MLTHGPQTKIRSIQILNPVRYQNRFHEIRNAQAGFHLGLESCFCFANIREVGADRIVNAVAAYERHKELSIVVDFGTATTFDVLSAKGEYLGGAITPGVNISLDALFDKAAGLRRVELSEPRGVIGRNTAEAIQSGVMFGYAALVDGICERIEAELGPCTIVSTGGLATVLAPFTRKISTDEPWLTLHGLRLVYARNRK